MGRAVSRAAVDVDKTPDQERFGGGGSPARLAPDGMGWDGMGRVEACCLVPRQVTRGGFLMMGAVLGVCARWLVR